MQNSWDWVEEELKKIQTDMPVDSEMMQVVDAISVADFWKRRYDEELMLWERKLEVKEEEKKNMQSQAQTHEFAIKELDIKLKELERRWEQEKMLLEDRVKAKETEAILEKTKSQWESRLSVLESENKDLKSKLGVSEGVAITPGAGAYAPQEFFAGRAMMEKQLKELEENLKAKEEESRKRLEKLEEEKKEVARALAEKESIFNQEKTKWEKLEKEVGGISGQMSQQLTNLKDREKEHFTILEDLARGFAHKVRNYLGIMSGTIQLCTANFPMDNELKEQLNIVDQNAQEMLKSIEEFLALARIPEMSLEAHNMNELLEGAFSPLEAQFKGQNIAVSRNFGSNLPAVKADKKLMLDAFVKLLQNALESMPQGGGLTLATAYDEASRRLSVKMTDTGSGISEAHIKKVFQPYFSSKKGRKGLGLTIAQRVIDLHRGTIHLERVKGKGTTVAVNLLLEPPSA